MNVAALQILRTPGLDGPRPVEIGPRPGTGAADFGDTLRNAIDRVDGAQKTANAQVEGFIAGEHENLHDVMIAMNDAQLHFQLMTEVRNRALETYQELMRIQV